MGSSRLGACLGSARVALQAAVLVVAAGCSESPSPEAAARTAAASSGRTRIPQFPVEVQRVEARDVEYRVVAVGSVEAFETVQVTARVQGVVEAVRFKEGDQVQRGQALVEIEPERFHLAVEAGRAALEKAEASHAEAEAGLERREAAAQRTPGVIPFDELEAWRTRARTATAEVALARSSAAAAELNLRDAFVRAPVGGTIQTRSVQTGEFVQPGTTLATLLRQDPLLLRFSVPEQDAARLQPGMLASFIVRESPKPYTARITHVAAGANPASRLVSVTAEVETAAGAPRPGAFAEVSVSVGSAAGAAVVPETAVRPSEKGFLAYVVAGGKAQERIVNLGMRTSDGRVEVRHGLAAGESVVVRGAEALQEGAAVRVVPSVGGEASAPAAGAGP